METAGKVPLTVCDQDASTSRLVGSCQQLGLVDNAQLQEQQWAQQLPPAPETRESGHYSRTYRASSASGPLTSRAGFTPRSGGRAPCLLDTPPAEGISHGIADSVGQLPERTEHAAAAGRRRKQPGSPKVFAHSTHRGGALSQNHHQNRDGRTSDTKLTSSALGHVSNAEPECASTLDYSRPSVEPASSSAEASRGGVNRRARFKKGKPTSESCGGEHYPAGSDLQINQPNAETDRGSGGATAASMSLGASRESDVANGTATYTHTSGRGAGSGRRYQQHPGRAVHAHYQRQPGSYSWSDRYPPAGLSRLQPDSHGYGRHLRSSEQLDDQRERQMVNPSADGDRQQNGPRRVGRNERWREDVQAVAHKSSLKSAAQQLTTNDAAALGSANSEDSSLQLLSSACPDAKQPSGLTVACKSYDALVVSRPREEPELHRPAAVGSAGREGRVSAQVRRPSNRHWMQPTESSEGQLDVLTNQLWSNSLECMICCSIVRIDVAVWSCLSCYHIFHLFCIKKWASSATSTGPGSNTNGFCPACRVPFAGPLTQYLCFCGRVRDPPVNRHEVPHSCGEVCSRKRNCAHGCTLLCHPGPCPPCRAHALQSCDCGKIQQVRSCNAKAPLKCDAECGKLRECGRHACTERCHAGTCSPCMEQLEQACHCPRRTTRLVLCPTVATSMTSVPGFSCGLTCGQLLDCGKHFCTRACHSGPCPPCSRLPASTTHCPCGRFELRSLPLAKPRSACTDPVPTCDSLCKKRLPCYQESNNRAGEKHICMQLCHDGVCGPCKDEITVSCNCGSELKSLKCSTLTSENGEIKMPEFVCSKRCNAKMSCARHKCSRVCCSRRVADEEEVHTCLQVCGRLLSCGSHRCDELCHRGQCRPCPHASFDELRCHCGAEVIYPPVPCSTKPPDCSRPCQRARSCDHPVVHNCHPDSEPCARCVAFTQKWCVGQHELMTNVPCFLTEMACGRTCAKLLPCGVHKCTRTCHKGECLIDGKPCSQPCTAVRPGCGHACGVPCHGSQPCPSAATCAEPVDLKCMCGLRSGKVPCNSGTPAGQFFRISAGLLALKLSQATSGKVLDLGDEVYLVPEQDTGIGMVASAKEGASLRRLKCDEQCSIIERNRRFALALEIENPDLGAKLSVPAYSDFLRSFSKRDSAFVAQIEKALNNLVMQSKQDKRHYLRQLVHSFPPMNYDRRRVIHELAAFYGCTSESQDCEPNKSVVVTAVRNKCWMPSVMLLTAVQKDLYPKPPLPVLHDAPDEETVRAKASALKSALQGKSQSAADTVDYFDVID